ncbi:MAG: hypothetical protein GX780_07695 [Campylobacteraceae bacterium]|nr:hypothetical protein [Campylobacteraceae bacterium]
MEKEERLIETKEVLKDMAENNGNSIEYFNRRIDIDSSTMKRLNAMLPLYLDDIDTTTQKKRNEQISKMICKTINFMFENDFKHKLDKL